MQFDSLPDSESGLLDALVDQLTIDPNADIAAVLAHVDQVRAAHTTGVKQEQRQTKQRQQRAADLQQRWADAIRTARQTPLPQQQAGDVEDESHQFVAALTKETIAFLQEGSSAASRTASHHHGWRTRSAAVAPSLSLTPDLVTSALSPLLASLSNTAAEHNSRSSTELSPALRRAYLRVLPHALHAATGRPVEGKAVSATQQESSAVTWYDRAVHHPAVRELFAPYVRTTVDAPEKELRYHFASGKETAVLHEPQHFFTFLDDCVTRQQEAHRRIWAEVMTAKLPSSSSISSAAKASLSWTGVQDDPSDAPVLQLLDGVGQLTLAAAAVVTFQRCYGWQPSSPLWRSAEFVVVAVNAVLDFASRAEGRLSRDAVQLLLGHLLLEPVMVAYAEAGVTMADRALQSGAARLWRRSFLMDHKAQPRCALHTCSLHLVRALEAFLRRLLNTLFVLDATYAALIWTKTVEPALSHFLAVVEAEAIGVLDAARERAEQEAVASAGAPGTSTSAAASAATSGDGEAAAVGASWHTVLALQWCVASVQVVTTAAEDWLGMLRESVGAAAAAAAAKVTLTSNAVRSGALLITSDALDGLALFRDTLARRAAAQAKALTRHLCTHRIGDGAHATVLLHQLNDFLQQLETLPESSSRYVLPAVIQGVMHDTLPREQQAGLAVFASHAGLSQVARLLTN